jgi:hypothetical protein
VGRILLVAVLVFFTVTNARLLAQDETFPKCSTPVVGTWPLKLKGVLDTPDGFAYVHLKCTVSTKKSGLTLGVPLVKPENADIIGFKEFIVVLADKKIKTAAALTTIDLDQDLSVAPSGSITLRRLKDVKIYEWPVQVLFLVPAETKELTFQFGKQKAVAITLLPKK